MLALVNGQLVVGEIKAHPLGFDRDAIDSAVFVGRLLRPDKLILAAEGDTWPEEVLNLTAKAREELTPLDIEVEHKLLRW